MIRFKNLSKFYSSNCNELKIIYRTLTSKSFGINGDFYTKIYTRKPKLVVSFETSHETSTKRKLSALNSRRVSRTK